MNIEKKKIEKRDIGIETEREEIVEEKREKKDMAIATEGEEIVEENKVIELKKRKNSTRKRSRD